MTGTTPIIKESLRLGIEAARNGNKETARAYLTKVIRQTPENIPALFWLAYVVESPQESITLLERVLALDPDNVRAKDGIRWAKKQLGTTTTEAGPDSDIHQSTLAQLGEESPESPDDFIRDQLLSKEEFQRRAKKGALAHRARRTIDPLLTIAIILSAAAMLTLGIWVLALTPADTLAAWLPDPVESALVGPKPSIGVSLEQPASAKPKEQSAVKTVSPIRYFASTSDTIILEAPPPTEIDATEPELSIPIEVSEPAPESEELISPVEESNDLISTPIEEPTEIVSNASEAGDLISTPLSDFIGPADTVLTGPRLYEPVDYELLYRQPASPDEKWIEVNVTEQRVTAWEGNVPVMSFLTSTGLPNTPTVLGEYNIYWKLESTLMTGPDYYLPEVPYTMYFYAGYALHGAYWHDNFGNPMSHGCVNLSIDNAKEIFEWADPILPPGQTQVISTYENPGTLVVVHQ